MKVKLHGYINRLRCFFTYKHVVLTPPKPRAELWMLQFEKPQSNFRLSGILSRPRQHILFAELDQPDLSWGKQLVLIYLNRSSPVRNWGSCHHWAFAMLVSTFQQTPWQDCTVSHADLTWVDVWCICPLHIPTSYVNIIRSFLLPCHSQDYHISRRQLPAIPMTDLPSHGTKLRAPHGRNRFPRLVQPPSFTEQANRVYTWKFLNNLALESIIA